MPRKPANCYIIAGPNGAGKTTFATDETTVNDAALYEQLRRQYEP